MRRPLEIRQNPWEFSIADAFSAPATVPAAALIDTGSLIATMESTS